MKKEQAKRCECEGVKYVTVFIAISYLAANLINIADTSCISVAVKQSRLIPIL